MTDEAKGRWVEKGSLDIRNVVSGKVRAEYDIGSGGTIVRYWQWEEALPLPDKPGVRFWGKTEEGAPQWWFTCKHWSGSVQCTGENGDLAWPGALTRLPDPGD